MAPLIQIRSRDCAHKIGTLLLAVLVLSAASCQGEPNQAETTENEPNQAGTTEKPSETTVGNLLETLDGTLVKLEERKEVYENAGNPEGARLMEDAAVDASEAQAALVALEEADTPQEEQEDINEFIENREQLEQDIDIAQGCCGLPLDFLEKELGALHAEAETLRTRVGPESEEPIAGPAPESTTQYRGTTPLPSEEEYPYEGGEVSEGTPEAEQYE